VGSGDGRLGPPPDAGVGGDADDRSHREDADDDEQDDPLFPSGPGPDVLPTVNFG
jgi:hypothetical protein